MRDRSCFLLVIIISFHIYIYIYICVCVWGGGGGGVGKREKEKGCLLNSTGYNSVILRLYFVYFRKWSCVSC